MKEVSDAYKRGMLNGIRQNSFARVYFYNIDVDAAGDGEWEGNNRASWSNVSTLDNPYAYGNTIATLELNRWVLDGEQDILPNDASEVHDGFVSNVLSGRSGSFATAAIVTREFKDPHTFRGITLTFDSRSNEWPYSVSVSYYLEGTAVDTQTASPDGVTVEIPNRAEEVDKVVITFLTGLPYRRARLQYVMFGLRVTFENDDIISANQENDIDPLSRRLPSERFEFTIHDYQHRYDPDNPQGEWEYVDIKSPIYIQYGMTLPNKEIEWLKPDKYLLDSKPEASRNRATFTATGLIGTMTGLYYKSKVGEKTFYDMAEDVLLDAGLSPTDAGRNPWVIDKSLKDMTTTAVLPIDTNANCLQLIAHACCCRLFTDDDNIIHLKPFRMTLPEMYSGAWEDNGHTSFSDWSSVDKDISNTRTYVTLELNRWTLDGVNQEILPSSNTGGTGFTSSAVSNSSGNYGSAPLLTKTFDVENDLRVIQLVTGDGEGEYIRKLQIRYYSGDDMLLEKVVSPTSNTVKITSEATKNITRIEIDVLENLPRRRARVIKAYYRESDFVMDFDKMIGDQYQSLTKIEPLKEVTVAKYCYTPEDDETGSLENLDTVYF